MEQHFDNRKLGIGNRESSDESRISNPEYRVIYVGCGSGILSIAALKLGAKNCLGVDIDIESVKNSRENSDTNGIGDELILGQGSVAEVLAGHSIQAGSWSPIFGSGPLFASSTLVGIWSNPRHPRDSGPIRQISIETAQIKGLSMNDNVKWVIGCAVMKKIVMSLR
jgi:hypothetical protein